MRRAERPGEEGAAGQRRRATEVTTRVPVELRERLREAARNEGVSMNAYVLELLKDRLDNEQTADERIEFRARELTLRLASRLLEHGLTESPAKAPGDGCDHTQRSTLQWHR